MSIRAENFANGGSGAQALSDGDAAAWPLARFTAPVSVTSKEGRALVSGTHLQ